MRKNHGFTLVELLVAMTIFAVVLGGAMKFVTAQSRAFTRGVDDISVLQNLSFGADNLDSQLRTAGGNAPDAQPPVVYANANTFAFNADYVANDLNDISAVYIDPDAPPAEVEAIRLAQQFVIPGSAPAFNYPSIDYSVGGGINSPAETIILFFTADPETARADDFLLLRQVNNNPPEVLVRKILPDSTNLPFFRYYKQEVRGGINTLPTLSPVAAAELPLRHTVTTHGSPADAASPIDSLRAVLVSYMVTNGYTDSRERRQRISVKIPLPNMGLKSLKICGGEPVLATVFAGAHDPVAGVVNLTWTRAFDESTGERDVVRYVLWRRKTTDPQWSDPLTSVNASGAANYLYADNQNLEAATNYEYRLAAQDCSPKLSLPVTIPVATAP